MTKMLTTHSFIIGIITIYLFSTLYLLISSIMLTVVIWRIWAWKDLKRNDKAAMYVFRLIK